MYLRGFVEIDECGGGGIVVVVICGTRRITQCEMNDQNRNSLCNVLKAYIINTIIVFVK